MNPVDFLKGFQGTQTQNEFADQLRISRSLLSMIYNGEREVTPFVLARLGELYPEKQDDIARVFFAMKSHNSDVVATIQESPANV